MPRLYLISMRAILWGLVAAVAGSVPAAVRLKTQGQSWMVAWTAVAGVLCIPSVLAVLGGALARRGWRELVRGRTNSILVSLGLSIAVFCPIAVEAGIRLHKTTHHRGLGGATFGAVALGAAALAAVAAVRLSGTVVAAAERKPKVAGVVGPSLLSCGVVLAVGFTLRALHGAGLGWASLSARTQVALVDTVVWLFCVVVGCILHRPEELRRGAGVVIVTAVLSLTGVGVGLVRHSTRLARAVWMEAPVAASLAEPILAGAVPTESASDRPRSATPTI